MVAVIRNHDVLGRLARYWLTAQQAADLFGTRRLADLTERLTVADISSIRGLGGVLPSIASAYAATLRVYEWREANVRPPAAPPDTAPAFRWPLRPRAALRLTAAGGAEISGEVIALLEAIDETGTMALRWANPAAAAEPALGKYRDTIVIELAVRS